MVLADALSACAATKFVSQISLNNNRAFENDELLSKQTLIIQLLTMYPDNRQVTN